MTDLTPEALARIVRETWIAWARTQPDPKPSWLIGWDDLDAGQREVDTLIGVAVRDAYLARDREAFEQHYDIAYQHGRADERHECAELAAERNAVYPSPEGEDWLRFADLLRGPEPGCTCIDGVDPTLVTFSVQKCPVHGQEGNPP